MIKSIDLSYFLSSLQQKGKIVYEYNPFRNFRLTEPTEIDGIKKEAGSIIDLDTERLNFSLDSPVVMDLQQSYDGSINVILNDNKNIPRLINSRFSPLQNNTYEIVDRVGNNDTNLYDDGEAFDIDTSLYKRINTIPEIRYEGVITRGNLKVGNYVFYIKLADADDNESDFVGESGLVSVFIGNDLFPHSVNGGFRDQNANKSVQFTIANIDTAYDYVKVYYTRVTSDVQQSRTTSAYKINNKYPIQNGVCSIVVTGDEDTSEISVDEINYKYFIVDKAKAQAQCQNMLFLGNVNKHEPDHADLQDISLRIYPTLDSTDARSLIGELNELYNKNSGYTGTEYFSTSNIYNYVGYWDEEIYRFGIVYILKDGSLTPVYNTRGITIEEAQPENPLSVESVKDEDNGKRKYLTVDEHTYIIGGTPNHNSKGVCRFQASTKNLIQVYGVKMYIPQDVITYLEDKVQGFFFVRQKRIPNILAQMYTLPLDKEARVPVIYSNGNYRVERIFNNSRQLNSFYNERIFERTNDTEMDPNAMAAICPEFDVRSPYFNSLFTGIQFPVRECVNQSSLNDGLQQSMYNNRQYHAVTLQQKEPSGFQQVYIQALSDNMQIAAIQDYTFRARAGEAEEAWKFEYLGTENKQDDCNNIVRGIYSSYLGIVGNLDYGKYYNIYVPGYIENSPELFTIRYRDSSPYYAIGDRVSLDVVKNQFNKESNCYTRTYYRGDCFICNFTHRLNRNFQDPEAPTNDKIVSSNTWKENYKHNDPSSNGNINRGDVNAVELGSWITLKVLSNYNLSIRSLDPSYADEQALTGIQRGFYPLQPISSRGNTKIPQSEVINDAFGSTVGERTNSTLPDVPYIKNRYDTRIMYSDVTIGDAFRNGYRVFNFTHYRDYPKTYGGIMSLVELRGNIVCIFEHGIALIPVNERAVAGEGSGGNVFINTSNVLPENPKIISDIYGSQWPESVIKTPYGIYGVDTVAKKIWRTNGETFECISDFRVQEFLNQKISLTERELTPVIGIRNVKSHYNRYKGDIMFTFYDNTYGFEETSWNLCYNELLQKWITFYSWIPSYSANVYNQFFSFDRNTSKWISKLGASITGSPYAGGVTLDNVEIDDYIFASEDNPHLVGTLSFSNRELPTGDSISYEITYQLERDNYQNYKNFIVKQDDNTGDWGLYLITPAINLCSELYERKREDGTIITDINVNNSEWVQSIIERNHLEIALDDERGIRKCLKEPYNKEKIVTLLNIRAIVTINISETPTVEEAAYMNSYKNSIAIEGGYYESVVAVIPKYNKQFLTTDFWKHGHAGIIDIADELAPTYWYGKQHPFEIEFVIADNPQAHKIFDNLQIISNNAEPESFHYEIIGDCYDFAKDRKNMYIRQEATKELYQRNGCDITYDHDYDSLEAQHRVISDLNGIKKYDRSTLLPLYYSRQDTINEIEDSYHLKDDIPTKDFSALSGGEIVRYKNLGEYRIWNHAKAVDMERVGRLRGNMQYNEDKWLVQINPLNLVYKNELEWGKEDLLNRSNLSKDKIPIELGQSPIPDEVLSKGDLEDSKEDIPQNSRDRAIVSWNWKDSQRKESKLKDKWIKIRIRYSGEKLAIISAINTLYSISYS